jgi:hypothetical protein
LSLTSANFGKQSLRPITAASTELRALDIEQSALGRNILKLERALGMSKFERSRASVTPTLTCGPTGPETSRA